MGILLLSEINETFFIFMPCKQSKYVVVKPESEDCLNTDRTIISV